MVDLRKTAIGLARGSVARAEDLGRSRWMRRIGKVALASLAIFTLVGFLGVPLILRHVVIGRVAAIIHRPISVTSIRFNPYRLRLSVDQLHIGDRDGSGPFVDIGNLRIRVSWTSLFRLKPIVKQVEIDGPAIYIVRTGEQQFNFSDLIASPSPPPPRKPGTAKPLRFAVSNIQLNNGDVRFDDKLLGEHHHLEHIVLGIPFIANLPADVDIFVQPLLHMIVDGSPLHITGKARPFAVPAESTINLNFHRLELARYLAYSPKKLPIKMPQGTLSCAVQVHFVNAPTGPVVRLDGEVALDKVDVRDESNAPLAGLDHFIVTLADVEPLNSIVHLGKIRTGGLTSEVVRNPDGTTNLTRLAAGDAASKPQRAMPAPAAPPTPSPATVFAPASHSLVAAAPAPSAAPTPAATQTAAAAAGGNPADISLDSFELSDSAVRFTDNSGTVPAILSIKGIHIGLKDFRTVGSAMAPFHIDAGLGSGGSVAVKGSLDLARSQVTTEVSIDQVDLTALQGFAQAVLAATIASGKLNARANVQTHFAGGNFNVHAEPAQASIDNFKMSAPGGEMPVAWNRLSVAVGQADLASRQAMVNEIHADGLRLIVKRGSKGELNLASLARAPAPETQQPMPTAIRLGQDAGAHTVDQPRSIAGAPAQSSSPPPPQPAVPAWQYRIASVAVENTQVQVEDDTTPQPVKLALAPFNFHAKDLSSDFAKPVALDLDGTLNSAGTFKVAGTAVLKPFKADVRVATQGLDLVFANPYLTGQLNTTVSSAALTMNGAVGVAQAGDRFQVNYKGDATLGNVRMLDKLTGDDFVRWNSFSVNRIDANVGDGPPRVHIGGISLANFYARVILNQDGHLNVSDIRTNPQAAPKSLTRAQPASGAAVPAPAPAPSAAAAPINADIELGRITLQGGHVNYTDNFIKPNYSVDLTSIAGKVGAFGTRSSAPATVALQGDVNDSSPIDIDGSINPLTPMAFVDLATKADGIELTNLSAYSTKYTGYPIVKGTLTLDVHYLLDKGNLSATNHILIEQLTFGDKVESKAAINLRLRLAVALLKNSKGEIDLNVPISGSLSDPQFSVGSLLLHAFMNLIAKAATSPFTLIASAFGGGGGDQDLGHIDFAPGYATLTPESIARLTTIAKALQDRSGLRLGISGRVDPELDREGLREAKLAWFVRDQKVKAVGSGDVDTIEVTPAEYDKYLARVYKAAKFPKPKDFLGLTKSMPPEEMKKLLLTNMEVTDKDLKQLADRRGDAVRQWMSKQVDPARLFAVASQLNSNGIKDKGKTTRVELSLE